MENYAKHCTLLWWLDLRKFFHLLQNVPNHYPEHYPPTLISLINVGPTLTDFEKFHPPQNQNPPSTFIDFLDLAHFLKDGKTFWD